jgi:hypothetical protein
MGVATMSRNTITFEILGDSPGFMGFKNLCTSVPKNLVQDVKFDGGFLVIKMGYI